MIFIMILQIKLNFQSILIYVIISRINRKPLENKKFIGNNIYSSYLFKGFIFILVEYFRYTM